METTHFYAQNKDISTTENCWHGLSWFQINIKTGEFEEAQTWNEKRCDWEWRWLKDGDKNGSTAAAMAATCAVIYFWSLSLPGVFVGLVFGLQPFKSISVQLRTSWRNKTLIDLNKRLMGKRHSSDLFRTDLIEALSLFRLVKCGPLWSGIRRADAPFKATDASLWCMATQLHKVTKVYPEYLKFFWYNNLF